MFDALRNKKVVVVAKFLYVLADNPRAVKLSSFNVNVNFPCRFCKVSKQNFLTVADLGDCGMDEIIV